LPLPTGWKRRLTAAAKRVIRGQALTGHIPVVLANDGLVRQLNRDFRQKDKTTDVLSFPWDDDDEVLGEIYVSIPQVRRQAPRFGTTELEELERVLIHGLLHLAGHDHLVPSERKAMRTLEEAYLGRSPYRAEGAQP